MRARRVAATHTPATRIATVGTPSSPFARFAGTPTSTSTPEIAASPMSTCCVTWLPTVPTSTRPVASAPTMAPTVLAA